MKKLYKILAGIILFIAILLFAAPRVARWYIVKNGPELIGRKIDINRIRINYFTGTLRVSGLKLYESDAKGIFASFGKLKVNIDYLPLLRNEFVVKSISLADPYVQVLQDGSRFNFSDLIASDTTEAARDTVPKKPVKYIIGNTRISGGYLKYTDLQLDHTISLDSLDLSVPGFTWNSDSANLNVNFRFVNGGGLSSGLEINQADSTYSLNVKLDSLNLGIIEPYVKSNLKINALSGLFSSDLLIKGSMTSILRLFIHGVMKINDLQLLDTLDRNIFSLKELTAGIDTLQLEKNRIRLDSISIKDPYVFFEMIDSSNNWMELVKPSMTAAADSSGSSADSSSASSPTLSYNLPRITLTGGKIVLTDRNLNYPFEFSIDNLNADTHELPDVPGKLALHLSAGLNGTGAIVSDGVLNTKDYSNDMDLSLEISQFRMKDVDAYFRQYFGFPVTGGIMNFKTTNKLRVKSLDSNNNIYFRRFTLGEKMGTETRYKVPLRLALGILTDKNGVIDLKAPVKVKGEEVKIVNLGRIIFKVIGNLFVKAAVSPFNLLSGLVDTDPASLQVISLGLTGAAPDAKDLNSVDMITDILTNRPQLNVQFIYCIDSLKAADSLAYILSVRDYRISTGNMPDSRNAVPDSTLTKFLQGKSQVDTLSGTGAGLKALCRNYIGSLRLKSGLDSLKTSQLKFLNDYLVTDKQILQGRFSIIRTTPDSIKPLVSYPLFRVYFTPGQNQQQ